MSLWGISERLCLDNSNLRRKAIKINLYFSKLIFGKRQKYYGNKDKGRNRLTGEGMAQG